MTDLPRSSADAWIGRTVAEKYRIVACLGLGGHGAVFEAENTWTGRRVALKMLLGAAALHPEMAERFLREARATTRVSHPNIVEVLDMGSDPRDGTLFIVQELLQGEDLRGVLRRARVVDPRWLVATLAPLLEALAAAHAHGVIHRDLKPANLYLARQHDGRVVPKLIDFGVSRMDDAPGSNELTHAGALLGTPDYMSPEQARGERAGPQADIWAVGVILYEALAGHRPYRAANYNALLIRILADDPEPLRAVAPEIPEALAAVVHRALARDPAARYPSALALRDDLVAWAARAAADPSASEALGSAPAVDERPAVSAVDERPAVSAVDELTAMTVLPGSEHDSGSALVDADTPVSLEPPAGLRDLVNESGSGESPAAMRRLETLPATGLAPVAVMKPVTPATPAMTPAPWPVPVASAGSRSLAPWVFVGIMVVGISSVGGAWLVGGRRARRAAVRAVVPSTLTTPAATVATARVLDGGATVTDAPATDAVTGVVAARPRPVGRALPPPTIDRPEALEIRRVMRSADLAVSRCLDGRPATVQVALNIAGATGAVESVGLTPPWAGTPAGACVAAIVSRLRFSRFRQPRFQLSWPYVVRPLPPVSPGMIQVRR